MAAKNLVVRITDANARIWTGSAPTGTVGATPLDKAQSKALRDGLKALAADDAAFTRHAAQLAAGKTVKARPNGKVANLILSVFPPAQEQEQESADLALSL